MMKFVQTVAKRLSVVGLVSLTLGGCGPSADGPRSEWFVGEWFVWDMCFDSDLDPVVCRSHSIEQLVVTDDGRATQRFERICGQEPPQELVWEEENERTIILRSAEPEETFWWQAREVEAVRLEYAGDCRSVGTYLDDPEVKKTEWGFGALSIDRTYTDCGGDVVATTDEPCTRRFPRGFGIPDDE